MFGNLMGNLIGTVYVLLFQLVGISLISKIIKEEKEPVRLLMGSVAGSVLLHWCPILTSFFIGFNWASHMTALLIVFFVGAVINKRASQDKIGQREVLVQIKHHKYFVIASGCFFVLWIYLLYTHTLMVGNNGNLYTGQSTYGDMNMHLAFITSIAKQGNFPPDYSLYPGTKLSYPFLSASISSSMYLMGATLQYAYIFPMLISFLQILGSVYLLAYTVLKSRKKAILAYLFFFLNGGFGFVYFLDWNKSNWFSFKDIFTGFYTTPTNLVDFNIRWVNIIADMFVPQRATLFGYALLFSTIWLLHQAVFAGKKQYFLMAGIFASALPMIHTHSFLGIGLISGAWMLVDLYRQVKNIEKREFSSLQWKGGWFLGIFLVFMSGIQMLNQKVLKEDGLFILGLAAIFICIVCGIYLLVCYLKRNPISGLLQSWGIYIACILVLALPQLLFWTFGQVAEGGFLRGHFNWGNQGDFYIWFYIKNLGVVCLMSIGAICAGRKNTRHLLLPILIIWTISELIVFTPNTYDNNKLLYIGYLFLCMIAADYGVEFYRRLQGIAGRRLIAVTILGMAFLAAVLTLGREVVSKYPLYDDVQVELAQYIEENTEVTDVFLTDTRHNNEVASLAGRNIVCGSDVFLYFHGIDTTERKEHIRAMYEDPKNNEDLFELYDISYVVISAWERSNYGLDESFWLQEYEQVFSCQSTCLYRIK